MNNEENLRKIREWLKPITIKIGKYEVVDVHAIRNTPLKLRGDGRGG